MRLHDHPLPSFADQDTRHPYRSLGTALIADAPKALGPRNATLEVNVEVVGHQAHTVTGHRRDGMSRLSAGLPFSTVGGHMSCLGAAGEHSEHLPHVAHFLSLEHLVDNREDTPLLLSHSHGGHHVRMPAYLQRHPRGRGLPAAAAVTG